MKASELSTQFKLKAAAIRAEKSDTARFRARSYDIAAKKIEEHKGKTVTPTLLDKLELSDYMKEKAKEFMKNPIKNNLIDELAQVMGLGTVKAKELIKKGVKSISDLKKIKDLPEETKAFLKHRPLQLIERATIDVINEAVQKLSNMMTNTQMVIVGSYRRRKAYSRDIDIMVTSDLTLEKVFEQFKLVFPKTYVYSKGEAKISTIVDFRELFQDNTRHIYKVDLFKVDKGEVTAMLLYSTGSKEHNIYMRQVAKKQGYLLNQKGLFKDGKKIEKLLTEKDFFDKLQLKYKEPWER
jgi:DNA polymerase (family 10)